MRIWAQVTAGRGPGECQLLVGKIKDALIQEATAEGWQATIIDVVPGERPAAFHSVLVSVDGNVKKEFIASWSGSIQWICKSPLRPGHPRKNWFAGVDWLQVPEKMKISPAEFEFKSMRSSGPGGQHVNKTNSAIRALHIPTGLSIVAQEERSQSMNRQLALARILDMLKKKGDGRQAEHRKERWQLHDDLERGNPIRIYEGIGFKRKVRS